MATCIRPAALTAISAVDCATHYGQIVAAIFQREQTAPSFANEAALKVLANWTALIAAADATKVVKTPEFADFTIPSSEPQIADENSNASIDGAGSLVGFNTVKPTGNFLGLPSSVAAQLDLLEDEAAPGLTVGLTVFLVTADGRILHDNLRGFKVKNFYVGSTGSEGYNAFNKTPFGWTFDGKWDRNLVATLPNFNARQALNA